MECKCNKVHCKKCFGFNSNSADNKVKPHTGLQVKTEAIDYEELRPYNSDSTAAELALKPDYDHPNFLYFNQYNSEQELDLDFLENRHKQKQQQIHGGDVNDRLGGGMGGIGGLPTDTLVQSPIEVSPESVDRVKVIILGASCVGKTSIVQQFVWNDFVEEYEPTDRKHTYYPSVITNNRLYEIKISDLPVIPYFPVNSYYEWTDYRFYGLRNATAYILVFDLSNVDTFQYIRTIREQMCESRNMMNVPILVIGNKQDLIHGEGAILGGGAASASSSSSGVVMSSSGGGGMGMGVGSGTTKAICSAGSNADERRRDIANLVKKHWKCAYIECSAKYNLRVTAAFKELISLIDNIDIRRDQSPIMDNIQEALDRNKCTIL